jgi:hypothetical protein
MWLWKGVEVGKAEYNGNTIYQFLSISMRKYTKADVKS